MTIEEIRKIALALNGVTEDIKWEDHLCFNIGGKMFLVTSPDHVPVSASFQVSDEEFDELSHQPGFMPAPYMAKHKWVHLDDIKRLTKKQWQYYIRQSYHLKAQKLPKKLRKELGIE